MLRALKTGQIGSLALDVYEEEGNLFFEDRSDEILDDDNFARLLTYPNVLITAHQAFLTHEALAAIAETTLANVTVMSPANRAPTSSRRDRSRRCTVGHGARRREVRPVHHVQARRYGGAHADVGRRARRRSLRLLDEFGIG